MSPQGQHSHCSRVPGNIVLLALLQIPETLACTIYIGFHTASPVTPSRCFFFFLSPAVTVGNQNVDGRLHPQPLYLDSSALTVLTDLVAFLFALVPSMFVCACVLSVLRHGTLTPTNRVPSRLHHGAPVHLPAHLGAAPGADDDVERHVNNRPCKQENHKNSSRNRTHGAAFVLLPLFGKGGRYLAADVNLTHVAGGGVFGDGLLEELGLAPTCRLRTVAGLVLAVVLFRVCPECKNMMWFEGEDYCIFEFFRSFYVVK